MLAPILAVVVLLLAASPALAACTVSTVASGAGTVLRIAGAGESSRVAIAYGPANVTVDLDCNGNGAMGNPGDIHRVIAGDVVSFDIRLGEGDDRVAFAFTDDFVAKSTSILVYDLSGNDRFSFISQPYLIQGASVLIDVVGLDGHNHLDLAIGDITGGSTFTVVTSQGGGDDIKVTTTGLPVPGPSRIVVDGVVEGNTTVTFDVDLGRGNNDLLFAMNRVISGGARVSAKIVGGSGAAERDNVVVNLEDAWVDSLSSLNIDVQLLDGNDIFKLNYANFRIANTETVGPGGQFRLSVDGGAGNDRLTIARTDAAGTPQSGPVGLDGILEVFVNGGEGNDTINVDLGGAGFFTTIDVPADVPSSVLRGLRLRAHGGIGTDTTNVGLSNDMAATFNYDVIVTGGLQSDTLNVVLDTNGAGVAIFPFSVVDGGLGADGCMVAGLPTRNCP